MTLCLEFFRRMQAADINTTGDMCVERRASGGGDGAALCQILGLVGIVRVLACRGRGWHFDGGRTLGARREGPRAWTTVASEICVRMCLSFLWRKGTNH